MRKTGNRVCCVFEAHEQHRLLSFWAVWVKFWSGVEVLVSGFYFSGARFLSRHFCFIPTQVSSQWPLSALI